MKERHSGIRLVRTRVLDIRPRGLHLRPPGPTFTPPEPFLSDPAGGKTAKIMDSQNTISLKRTREDDAPTLADLHGTISEVRELCASVVSWERRAKAHADLTDAYVELKKDNARLQDEVATVQDENVRLKRLLYAHMGTDPLDDPTPDVTMTRDPRLEATSARLKEIEDGILELRKDVRDIDSKVKAAGVEADLADLCGKKLWCLEQLDARYAAKDDIMSERDELYVPYVELKERVRCLKARTRFLERLLRGRCIDREEIAKKIPKYQRVQTPDIMRSLDSSFEKGLGFSHLASDASFSPQYYFEAFKGEIAAYIDSTCKRARASDSDPALLAIVERIFSLYRAPAP